MAQAKPTPQARLMFGPPRRRPAKINGTIPTHAHVAGLLGSNHCPNGCGELQSDACKHCGFTFERVAHAPIPEWML